MKKARIDHIFNDVEHRPWPLADEQWQWRQTWKDLAFVHWEIDESEIRSKIPLQLEIDKYEGKAYIGIVPFRMSGVTKRGYPAPPYFCDFPEINVRTYVMYADKPGVFFFSLDVTSFLAAWFARLFFHLPYYRAKMLVNEIGTSVNYSHSRQDKVFEATYGSKGKAVFEKESFELWLTERYCLYSNDKLGNIFCADVHHQRWSLETAELKIKANTMLNDFKIRKQHPSVLFSKSLDVAVYQLKKINLKERIFII